MCDTNEDSCEIELILQFILLILQLGWSGGAMVLGKLPVPGRPANLDFSRARAYCACSRCGWGCLDIFTLLYLFSPLSPSLWETARHRLKYCLKKAFKPKTTNQPSVQTIASTFMHGFHRDYYMGFFLYHVYEPENPVSDRGLIA